MNSIALMKFSATKINDQNWPLPIKVELLDRGMNPIYEMEAIKDDCGRIVYPKAAAVPGRTLAVPGPYTVRFTVEGKTHFEDFPG